MGRVWVLFAKKVDEGGINDVFGKKLILEPRPLFNVFDVLGIEVGSGVGVKVT